MLDTDDDLVSERSSILYRTTRSTGPYVLYLTKGNHTAHTKERSSQWYYYCPAVEPGLYQPRGRQRV